jgi:hypothetical protein
LGKGCGRRPVVKGRWKEHIPPSIPLRERVSGAWWKVKRTFISRTEGGAESDEIVIYE